MPSNDPCQTCGEPARETRRKGRMSLVDTSPPMEVVRVCTNQSCPTNTGQASLGDVV